MKYNKSKIRTKIRLKFLQYFDRSRYYLYPKFRVARDMTQQDFYREIANDALLLNIGAGEFFYHKKWKSYDLYEKYLTDNFEHFNNLDLRDTDASTLLPNSVDAIYFGHTIEHIPENKLDELLQFFHSILKQDGILRIVCPNADLIYDAYRQRRENFFAPYKSWFSARGQLKPSLEDYLLQLIATPKCQTYTAYDNSRTKISNSDVAYAAETMTKESFLNFLTSDLNEQNSSGTDHLNWFNHEKLRVILEKNGFNYSKSAFGQSVFPPFRQVPLFDETMPCISMYADVSKKKF